MPKNQMFAALILFLVLLSSGCQTIPEEKATETATVIVQSGNLIEEDSTTEATSWWNDVVFYEIFVRSFKDSDGDGIGDFNGIIQQLDYLNDGNPDTSSDLGIGGIWLMPIMPSPTYHGYDVTNYKAVNPDYGTMADFKRLLQEAHKRGIKVIIDLVINHTSTEHPWFIASQGNNQSLQDLYVWSDNEPSNKGPWGQDPWHQAANGKYYYGVFWEGMPDLNYNNPIVSKLIYSVSEYWLKQIGVDGFRVDAARYLYEDGLVMQDTDNTIKWFQDWRKFYKQINPDAFTVGEVWTDLYITAEYADPKGLDNLFMFDLAEDIIGSVYAPDASRLIRSYKDVLKFFPEQNFSTFLSNHDQQRSASFFKGNVNKSKLAAFIYLTGPGTPFIYYGEEIGMTGNKPDEMLRTPLQWTDETNAGFTSGTPWEAINEDWKDINVEKQALDSESLLTWYQQLIKIRNEHPALRDGSYLPFTSTCKKLYAVLRISGADQLITIANLDEKDSENCTISIESSPLNGEYKIENLWGTQTLENIVFSKTGSVNNVLLTSRFSGNQTLIIRLMKP